MKFNNQNLKESQKSLEPTVHLYSIPPINAILNKLDSVVTYRFKWIFFLYFGLNPNPNDYF
jgi:hypothetical protein